jgi:hypothetical protein
MMTSTHTDDRSGRIGRFTRYWPVAAGVAMAVAVGADLATAGQILTASAFVYLGSAALGHRSAAWPVFAVAFVVLGVGRALPGIGAVWLMLGLAALLAVYGLARGAARPWWGLPLQAGVLVVLAGVALLAVQVSDLWAGLLVAGGLLAHAASDVHHHRSGRVVVRSLAEFCAVLDGLLAVLVLVATLG